MMNRNELGEEETKETSGRRKRTCKGTYRRTQSTRTQRKASVTGVQSCRRTQYNRRFKIQVGHVGCIRNAVLIPRVT